MPRAKRVKYSMINALTIDVEDYFNVSGFESNIRFEDWGNYQSRVEANTDKILEILQQADVKATFFVLGWISEKYPDMVRRIYREGHDSTLIIPPVLELYIRLKAGDVKVIFNING